MPSYIRDRSDFLILALRQRRSGKVHVLLCCRALSAGESSAPKKAPPLQLQEWLSGSPQNLGSGSHLVLNFVQEASPRYSPEPQPPTVQPEFFVVHWSTMLWTPAARYL